MRAETSTPKLSAPDRHRTDLVALRGALYSLGFPALNWWAGGRLTFIPYLPDTGHHRKLTEAKVRSRATAWPTCCTS